MHDTKTLMQEIARVDQRLATFGAVGPHERDGLLLKRRALVARLHSAQQREARRPALRAVEGGWTPTMGLDVA